MSQDFRIAFPCPHFTVEERPQIADDRRTLLLRQPISSGGNVRITANDELLLPSMGLLVPAQMFGRLSGPFNIVPNENTLTVRSSRETVEGIVLPTGLRVATAEVVRVINNALVAADSAIQITSSNGRLVFTDIIGVGPASRVEIRGDAASALGFDLQVGDSGAQIYPGWDVIQRTDDPLDASDRYVRFRQPLQPNAILKVTYAVPGQRCLRCRGTFVENDYRFDRFGEPLLISNEDLLVQAAQKIVLTEQGSNPFEPWYGTRVHEKVGLKAIGAVSATIQEEVQKALARFQQLQTLQGRVQQVSSSERLFQLLEVSTQDDPQDPTFVNVNVVAANASGRPVNLSITFTTPGAVALAGSLGQSLGIGV